MDCPNGSFCSKWKYFTDQNEPKRRSHKNEFWIFSKTKMNVTNSWSRKSRWKNGVICLVSMFPSWAMVLKLSKKVYFLQFFVNFCNYVLTSARKLSLSKQFTYIHLKVLITLIQKMIWFGVWVTVHEILANNITKKMLTQQKIIRLQILISPKQ